jgi:small subunit ribosomal protein S1
MKHDGIVPSDDIDRLDEEEIAELKPGQEVKARVVRPSDQEDRLILSFHQVQADKDWVKAEAYHDQEETFYGQVTGYNKGGLLVKFEHLEGFVPKSHLVSRRDLKQFVGQELPLKVIEVNQDQHRLILSERLAKQELQEEKKEKLMNELMEGQVVKGTVSHLTDFGAFIDLGGAEGLVHISELDWRHVRHPSEVVQVGDEVEIKVMRLDQERQRISLSMKALQANPWTWVDTVYSVDQIVTGTVTKVVDFGAFISLEAGIDGLLHVSQIAEPAPDDPREFLQRGEELKLRILQIDPVRERISLSLKDVPPEENEPADAEESELDTLQVAPEENRTS